MLHAKNGEALGVSFFTSLCVKQFCSIEKVFHAKIIKAR